MTLDVRFSRSAIKDMRKIPKHVRTLLWRAAEQLASDPYPYGYVKLRGYEQCYRIRIGKDYRMIYSIEEVIRIITITKIGHRKDVYRNI